jgi:CHRD domain
MEVNMKTSKYLIRATILVISMGAFVTKVDAEDQSGTRLRAMLKGFNETPAVSTPATGTLRAIIREDQSSITFELSYSGLVADSLFAHIHLGQKNVAGGVMIFFCDNSNPPNSPRSCPARGGSVSGTVTAADVIGPAGQGIAPGEFSKVLEAIRSGVTYVNVHSVQFPPGEIRGQVRVVNRKDDKSD